MINTKLNDIKSAALSQQDVEDREHSLWAYSIVQIKVFNVQRLTSMSSL